jgi:hypothetical protein
MSMMINSHRFGAPPPPAGIVFVGSKTFTHGTDWPTMTACSLLDLKDESNNNATLLQNDFLLYNHSDAGTGADGVASRYLPDGAGFTAISNLFGDDTFNCNQTVGYKFMGAVPLTTLSIHPCETGSGGVALTIHAFRGVNLTTPLDVAAVTGTGTNGGVPDCPAITPVTPGALIAACGASAWGGGGAAPTAAAYTNPANMSALTNHFRTALGPGPTAMVGTALKLAWAAGAFNPDAFGGGTTSTSAARCMTTVALRPA